MKCDFCGGRTYAKTTCISCEKVIEGIDKFLKDAGEKGQLFILEKYMESVKEKTNLKLKNPVKNQWWGVYNKDNGELLRVMFSENKPESPLCFFDSDSIDCTPYEIKRVIISRDEV